MAVEFTAVVDSGTSFTYLNDPAYTFLTTNVSLSLSSLFIILSFDIAGCLI